jgi:putative holliday junction resolvase
MGSKKEVGSRTILCFDFGTKSIGVAIGNELTGTANALPAIKANDGKPKEGALESLYAEWQPDIAVVGLPLNMDGTWQDVTFRARKFANRMQNKFNIQVIMKDERLTTKAAKADLFDAHGFGSLSKGNVDSRSAVVILESFMEELFTTSE